MPKSLPALLAATLIFLLSCQFFQNKKTNPPMAATFDYAAEWAAVDSLENQGLPQSALERTEAIATRAKADNNTENYLRSVIYKGKYLAQLEEDGIVKAIQLFETEQVAATQPQRAILQSQLAQLYATYLQNQGWKLSSRTPIPDGEGGDVLTWSATQIERRALSLYSASLQATDVLQSTPVDNLGALLTPGNGDSVNNQPLRPRLYDLLAHRALEYFSNDRSYLTEPTNKFTFNQPEAFALPEVFAKAAFTTQDTTSGKWLALKTYQEVTSAHLADGNPGALVDATLLRLDFARYQSALPNRKELYFNALEQLLEQFKNQPAAAEILAAQAAYWVSEADQNAGKPNNYRRKAATICENTTKQYPGTYGAAQCQAILTNLRQRELSAMAEESNLPNQPLLVQLGFRNLSQVWVRVVRSSKDEPGTQFDNTDTYLADLLARPAVQQRDWRIADPGDLESHTTEIKLDALPLGRYVLLVADNQTFSHKNGRVVVAEFSCTNIAAAVLNDQQQPRFVVMHRNTGAPLAGVRTEFFRQDWNSGNSVWVKVREGVTDQNGLVTPNLPAGEWLTERFVLGNDTLWGGGFGTPGQQPQQEDFRTVTFFTDRVLYRPGQTIYYKGILLSHNGQTRQPRILPQQKVSVVLFDANGQEKGRTALTTNEFGSFNGTFAAPTGGLTGSMSLVAEGLNGVNIQVEEYKRPRFEVAFKPLTGQYRLNDQVSATGEALNYSGNPVDGAKVTWRVSRVVRFREWGWGKMIPGYGNPEQEIANGTAVTDAQGKFVVNFTAVPDDDQPEADNPIFDYEITADVTDVSGETRSTRTSVSVSRVATTVYWSLQGTEFPLDSLKRVDLTFNNLANQPVQAKGTVTLQHLQSPRQAFVTRMWEKPDVQTLGESEFRTAFPLFAYGQEDDPKNWAADGAPLTFDFDHSGSQRVDLSRGVASGWYRVRVNTKDAYGQPIEKEQVVRFWSANSRFADEIPGARSEQTALQPGDNAQLWLGVGEGTLNVLTLPLRRGEFKPVWSAFERAKRFDTPVLESDRGGLGLLWLSVRHNRLSHSQHNWPVPFSNKELSIKFETFRDQLAPGQQEEWRLRISGPKKEKVAAEVVAGLYDASLDQFYPFSWQSIDFVNPQQYVLVDPRGFGGSYGSQFTEMQDFGYYPSRSYSELNWFNFPLWGGRMRMMKAMASEAVYDMAAPMAAPAPGGGSIAFTPPVIKSDEEFESASYGLPTANRPVPTAPPSPTPLRTNLNETVFFFPTLATDANGDVLLKFKMNEALTRWKLQVFAHSKDLQVALAERTVVTKKDLMITANPPRFLRAGDEFEFSAKVSNLTQQALSGQASLALLDATTGKVLEKDFGLTPGQNFTVAAGQSTPVLWRLKVPADFTGAVTWRVFAETPAGRDGEESTVPVVTNRMLVTETLPMTVRGGQTRDFVFESLKTARQGSRVTQKVSLEFTSNPVWYAVQSLPYLMEYPHECSEQIFSRFYANTLATSVVEQMPQVRKVFERWKGTDAMKSNLAKNQDLKSALLEETPWVLAAQSEEQQRQQIALLFDLNRMADERTRALGTLAERQNGDGGWAWFPGGQPNWSITQHIACGLLHLQRLEAFDPQKDQQTGQMLEKALTFCGAQAQKQYDDLAKRVEKGQAKWDDDHLDPLVVQWLYAQSFLGRLDRPDRVTAYYLGQAEKYWLQRGLHEQAMLALVQHRIGNPTTAQNMVRSLRERAQQKEELGMYWANEWGAYWYQLPIETQALMVEVFDEVAADRTAVENLRIWLLKNKQTNRWESTKATAEAVYALLLHGDNWLNNQQTVQVKMGNNPLKVNEVEAGTGYFKQEWTGKEAASFSPNLQVQNPNSNIVWGAAYVQYFDDLDQIGTFKKTGLTLVKQLFVEENSAAGPVLRPVPEGATLKVGDKLKVRLEIRSDRPMEFVHLKDLRAAGTEPVNVLSGYRWQGGLGYYESTRDLATNFFFDYLPRGTFVLEYPLVVSHRGQMSVGIATLQSLYAPEFASHSAGIRVKVD